MTRTGLGLSGKPIAKPAVQVHVLDMAIYYTRPSSAMAQAVANPTLATVAKVQQALEDADGPVSRYELHKRLEGTVNYPVLDAVLAYFSRLRVVHDEGAGGKVLWIHNPKARALFESSRRVA